MWGKPAFQEVGFPFVAIHEPCHRIFKNATQKKKKCAKLN